MEGWLYGLFALLGVLAGGFFTYLGMKKQLEQQRELDSCAWRRKVRSKPLLKLRDELAIMATKQARYLSSAHRQHTHFDVTEEQAQEELQIAIDSLNTYLISGEFSQAISLQYDTELVHEAGEILRDFQNSSSIAIQFSLASKRGMELPPKEEFLKSLAALERNETRIIELQELINKRLEEL